MVSYEYIAGFFDGEGYVALTRRHKTQEIELVVSISNTHRRVMDEIQKIVGSVVTFHTGGKMQYKPHYRLTFNGKKALDFLIAIQPYSIVKREEIDLGIEFIKQMKPRWYGHPLTDKEYRFRTKLYDRMMSLKGNRGSNTETLPIRGSKST